MTNYHYEYVRDRNKLVAGLSHVLRQTATIGLAGGALMGFGMGVLGLECPSFLGKEKVEVRDVNRDGIKDVVLSRGLYGKRTTYLGQKDGSYASLSDLKKQVESKYNDLEKRASEE